MQPPPVASRGKCRAREKQNRKGDNARKEHKMKNRKEYLRRLEQGDQFGGWDYLRPDDLQDLRAELKSDKARGAFALDDFNGRAVIIPRPDLGGVVLKSFYTIVAAYIDGVFYKTWDGWSATSAKHIAAFCNYCKIPTPNKYAWIMADTTSPAELGI